MKSKSEIQQGWRLIVAACLGVICSVIVLPYYSIGALVIPVTTEFGWSRSEFQTAILFSAGLGALTAPAVGWLIDTYGPRRVALPSIFGLSFGLLIASNMNGELWVLYLAYGAMALLGAGTIPVTWTRIIATNFHAQRGLALGLTLTGTGICAVAAPHYTVYLTDHYGWRAAYLGLALFPLIVVWPIIYILLKPIDITSDDAQVDATKANDLNSGLSITQAVKTYRFWVLLFSIFIAYMAFSGIGTNLFASLIDDGLSNSEAATVLSIYGGSIVIGRVVVGYFIDLFWAPGIATFALLMPMIGSILFYGTPSFYTAAIASFLIGFAAGAELDLMSFLTAKYFGLKHYAKIYSIMYACLAVCSGIAPMLFAKVYDQTQNYNFGFFVTAILFGLASAMMLLMGRYPKSLPQAERK
jgi:MFS family permease